MGISELAMVLVFSQIEGFDEDERENPHPSKTGRVRHPKRTNTCISSIACTSIPVRFPEFVAGLI